MVISLEFSESKRIEGRKLWGEKGKREKRVINENISVFLAFLPNMMRSDQSSLQHLRLARKTQRRNVYFKYKLKQIEANFASKMVPVQSAYR